MRDILDLKWAESEMAIKWARSTVWSRAFNVYLNGRSAVLNKGHLNAFVFKNSYSYS